MKDLIEGLTTLIVFGGILSIGLRLTVDQIVLTILRWRMALAMVGAQVVCIPAAALLITAVLPVSGNMALAILLIAAMPAGGISGFYVKLAKGDAALSLLMTICGVVIAFVTVPAILWMYSLVLSREASLFLLTPPLVVKLLFLVITPIVGGVTLNRLAASFSASIEPVVNWIVLALIALTLALIVYREWQQVSQMFDWQTAGLALVPTTALLIGAAVARVMTQKAATSTAIAFEFGVRNIGIAAYIAVAQLERMDIVAILAVYVLIESIIIFAAVMYYRFNATNTANSI